MTIDLSQLSLPLNCPYFQHSGGMVFFVFDVAGEFEGRWPLNELCPALHVLACATAAHYWRAAGWTSSGCCGFHEEKAQEWDEAGRGVL